MSPELGCLFLLLLPGWPSLGRDANHCPKSAHTSQLCPQLPPQVSDLNLGVPVGGGVRTALPSPSTNTDPAVPGPGDVAENRTGSQVPQLPFPGETDTTGKEISSGVAVFLTVADAVSEIRSSAVHQGPPCPLTGPRVCPTDTPRKLPSPPPRGSPAHSHPWPHPASCFSVVTLGSPSPCM